MATNKKASASAKTKAGATAKASATAAKKVAPAKNTAAAKPAPAPAKKAAAKPVAKKAATPDKKTASKAAPAPARSAKPIKPAAKASKAAAPPAKSGKAAAPVKKAEVPAPKKAAPAPAKPAIKKEEPTKKVAEVKAAPAKSSANGGKAAASKSTPVKKTIKVVSKSVTARPAVVKDDSKQTTPIPIKKPAPPPEKRPSKVVMPEIKTKTVKPYNPDFTKSVLDQDNPIPSGPTMRYSDAELVEFKELINKKLDAAKKELAYLQGLITRKDEMGGDESESRYMTMEDGSVSMEREQLAQMASRQITFIDHLEKALMRIENKTYGICRVTGKLIDKARLRAVPHATLSIEAKNTMNK